MLERRIVVTGCIVAACPLDPAWLVPGVLTAGPGLQLETVAAVCAEHLALFGVEVSFEHGIAPPLRFHNSYQQPEIRFYSRIPIRIRVVQQQEEAT